MVKIAQYLIVLIISIISMINGYAQSKTVVVDHFDKVIISPHIQVTFKKGNTESVFIESSNVPHEKINIKTSGNKLQIYLDDAKMVTKNVTVKEKGWKRKVPIYKGTQVVATVTYIELKELSIGGEEVIICKSLIEREDFKLNLYGESKTTMNSLKLNSLQVSMYGESYLKIEEGTVNNQKYTVYGEGEINTLGIANDNTKITAFGEANFRINVSENLKVTAFGEATVAYQGNPSINKGIVIGDAIIQKMN